MERPVCVVHLYVRTFGMRRACEIVRCTLMWREMQTCIHEVCMDKHVGFVYNDIYTVRCTVKPAFFFAPEQFAFFTIQFRK